MRSPSFSVWGSVWGVLLLSGCGSSGSPAGPATTDAVADVEPTFDANTPDVGDDVASADAIAETAPDAKAPGAPVVLSLNLHCFDRKGTPYATNDARFAAIADAARDEGVTVIAVQEACVRGGDSAIERLAGALATSTGAKWSTTWAFAHTAWAGTEAEAEEGVGLLVRGAIDDHDAIVHRVQSGLVRVAAWVRVGDLRVWSIHFDHADAAARLAQARETAMRALVDADPGFRTVVAGDFNARAGDPAHAAFVSTGFRDLSSGLAGSRIDHVLTHRASGLSAASASLIFDGGDRPRVSDHPGVLVRLAETPVEPVTVTRIVAKASLAPGAWLALRGGVTPLSWHAGFAMRPSDEGWRAVLTEVDGAPVPFKVLRDDAAWMTGANATVTPGTSVTVEPSF